MRAETGPIKFDNDWTGVFIRGDVALYFAAELETVLNDSNCGPIARAVLNGLIDTLYSCMDYSEHNQNTAHLKPFEDCLK